jgi:hypothetical protein
MAKAVKSLPPPTMKERAAAAQARSALVCALNGAPWGDVTVAHIDLSRPRRGLWIQRWSGVPGLYVMNGAWCHDSLPGWQYLRQELETEMVSDLEALAERGVRPTEATR